MKIATVQFKPALNDLSQTIESLSHLLPQCASAKIVVLPELCNSGYNFEDKQIAWESSETIPNSQFIKYLSEHAAKNDQYIVSGFNERLGDFLYNSSILVGPQGYIGKYQKLHLFMNEQDFFEAGIEGIPVFDLGFCKLGMLVCFDWMFPEVWRTLALKGADLIAHPSNLVLPGFAQQAIPIHALINKLYIATANRIGQEGQLTFTGMSTIADPNGKVLYQAAQTEVAVQITNIDLSVARNKWITPRNHALEDRRPDQYQTITQTEL